MSFAQTIPLSHTTDDTGMIQHWDGHYRTYLDFFTELQATLDSVVCSTEVRLSSNVLISSDGEKGLTKALHDVFSKSTHLSCVKHLRDNIRLHAQQVWCPAVGT